MSIRLDRLTRWPDDWVGWRASGHFFDGDRGLSCGSVHAESVVERREGLIFWLFFHPFDHARDPVLISPARRDAVSNQAPGSRPNRLDTSSGMRANMNFFMAKSSPESAQT